MPEGPLLVYGPRSLTYDLGPGHPLTPRRFGPGIDLLRAVGAEPGLAPEPASDDQLAWLHDGRYIETVRRFGADPDLPAEAGIGPGDTPAFPGMHDASAAVAGGSIRAMEAVLRADVAHAFHPGGGLHHAMPDRASGFCVYDDPALAIAIARRAGLRVLYVDLDVHHGDGVEAMHLADPGVMTISVHESGRYLFPGTGFPERHGSGQAAGTAVNVPLAPGTGGTAWLAAVRLVVPALAAAFAPDVVVSQHGADSHAYDPLAHLWVTTTAMGEAARLVDTIAHRWAGGRWLSTGGGGYDVYRVVPRSWSLVWLAGAHREPPASIPVDWRERWAMDAARYGQAPLPERFDDPAELERPRSAAAEDAARSALETARLVRSVLIPRLVREAEDRGWWSSLDDPAAGQPAASVPALEPDGQPSILPRLDAAMIGRLRLAPRVVSPPDPAAARAIVSAALRVDPPALVSAAIVDDVIVGLAISAESAADVAIRPSDGGQPRSLGEASLDLLALGVAPGHRGRGLGTALLRAHLDAVRPVARALDALVTIAERDPVAPLALETRAAVARGLLRAAGARETRVPERIARLDRSAFAARLELVR
ncbi:MAG TPA: GNAT family N-acetyltransferase [Candidatus Dormibacteraeota bacterium]|nr:GNAT family N-acetyltransferase [Candidatus Dormibacteraeota bacterium]